MEKKYFGIKSDRSDMERWIETESLGSYWAKHYYYRYNTVASCCAVKSHTEVWKVFGRVPRGKHGRKIYDGGGIDFQTVMDYHEAGLL